MARKSGRDIHGWVIVDKPAGMGSTQVVAAVRRALDARKAGHAGTLDPDATGILAVALGEATKTVPFVEAALKCYQFEIAWGAETATDDASGAVIARSDARPTPEDVAAALPAFTGDIMQVPPDVSAVKVDGARAYDLAREGVELDLAARPLWVESLDLRATSQGGARLEMVCGKGGYVRAIARDLGRQLGCFGHVVQLRRLWSGPFTLVDAVALDAVTEAALLPLETALADLPQMRATEAGAVRLRNGNPGEVIGQADYGETVWVSAGGQPVCVGRALGGQVQPDRVFNL